MHAFELPSLSSLHCYALRRANTTTGVALTLYNTLLYYYVYDGRLLIPETDVWGGGPLLDGDGSTGAQEAGTRRNAVTPPTAAAVRDGNSTATTNRRRCRRHRHHRLHHYARNPHYAQQTPPLPYTVEGKFFFRFLLYAHIHHIHTHNTHRFNVCT